MLPPFSFEGVDCEMGDIPDVGEHTSAVLTELGFSDAEIASFLAEKAI
jgi:crotonobetainyl-CoA:carnitine CoA-transferase CaiB-like acyl-CoA transferase